MCKEKGKRCDHTWSASQRNLYNAKRRAARNAQRMTKAEEGSSPEKAEYYKSLMDKAEDEVKQYNEEVDKERAQSYQDALNEDKEQQEALNSINPTGSVFVEYSPEDRSSLDLGEGMTTFDAMEGMSPDTEVTVYRGVPKGAQSELNSGDFITTNKQLAKDYAGDGDVLETKVRAREILTQEDEHDGEEFLYRKAE